MNGILIIDKPKDFTSFDVVAVVRGCLRERRTGHTGTLDPMATGVLPILLGTATKAQSLLPDTDKEYRAKFRLGLTTDTLDITGKVLSQTSPHITGQQLEEVLVHFRGDIMQKPPMYSAVYKNGVRLYELARKGIEVEREERPVHISTLELLDFDESTQSGSLSIACSKGTYIRVICDDIGKALGCGCVMTELCRTKACGYTLKDAVALEEIRRLAPEGIEELEKFIRPVESIFSEYQNITISDKQAVRFKNGGALMLSRLRSLKAVSPSDDGRMLRVCSAGGTFLGLGAVDLNRQELTIAKLF